MDIVLFVRLAAIGAMDRTRRDVTPAGRTLLKRLGAAFPAEAVAFLAVRSAHGAEVADDSRFRVIVRKNQSGSTICAGLAGLIDSAPACGTFQEVHLGHSLPLEVRSYA